MSGIGYQRAQADRTARAEAKASGKPFISGFCGKTLPRTERYDPHRQCKGCSCDCHQTSGAEPVNDGTVCPSKGATIPSAAPTLSAPELHGLVYDMPEVAYHSHKGSLSTSMAKQLLPPGCPAKFHANRGKPWIKKEFDFGHVVHKLMLGKGDEIAVLVDEDGVPFDSRRTNAYKAAEKAAREANRIPILAKDYEHARGAAQSILDHPLATQLFGPGEAEVSAFWTDEETGILRRARFDFLNDVTEGRRLFLVDLKTAESAEPDAFGKKAADYGYAMQAAAYVAAVIALDLDPDPLFWFVAVEKEPPYIVSVLYADDDTLQIGRYLNRKALRIYAECLATDVWPTYQPEPAPLPLPSWFLFNNQEALNS